MKHYEKADALADAVLDRAPHAAVRRRSYDATPGDDCGAREYVIVEINGSRAEAQFHDRAPFGTIGSFGGADGVIVREVLENVLLNVRKAWPLEAVR